MGAQEIWLVNPDGGVQPWLGDGLGNPRRSGMGVVSIGAVPGLVVAKAGIFNIALPAIGADWLVADIAPTVSPSHLGIYVCVAVAGIFTVSRTNGGVTVEENLNQGIALVASAAYGFKVSWLTGDTINFHYSATGGNILRLIANEELL